MSLSIVCPHCQSTGKVPDEAAGKKVRCPRCKKSFTHQEETHEAGLAEDVAPALPPVPTPIYFTPSQMAMLERALVETCAGVFQRTSGMDVVKSLQSGQELVQAMKYEGSKAGTDDLPFNYGDILLAREAREGSEYLNRIRGEGVTDDDIRWWYNRNDIERRVVLKLDDIHKLAIGIKAVEEGLSQDSAIMRALRCYPSYGDVRVTKGRGGPDDRNLPCELKRRVDAWHRSVPEDRMVQRLLGCSSFNALVRDAMRRGEL
jgi:predicted Zn finger-like uncharacterized protein